MIQIPLLFSSVPLKVSYAPILPLLHLIFALHGFEIFELEKSRDAATLRHYKTRLNKG